MRPCKECTACCTWLKGSAYGHEFGGGKSCTFLCENGCSIHKVRPIVCENYFCAWAQELLPEEMRPDKCDVLVSVENKNNKQYLRMTSINGKKINTDILTWFKNWSNAMNTPVIYLEENVWKEL